MWLILMCDPVSGCGEDAIASARASRWNAQAAIVGFRNPGEPDGSGGQPEWSPAGVEGIAEGARFRTQAECLRALRRAMPVRDTTGSYANSGKGWERTVVDHGRDFVSVFESVGWDPQSVSMMRDYYYACFQEAPRNF
jgi:hypothetical protein